MEKLIIGLLLCLFVGPASGASLIGSGIVAEEESCTYPVSIDLSASHDASSYSMIYDNNSRYMGTSFTTTGAIGLRRVTLLPFREGSPTAILTAYIYSDDSDSPDALLGTSTSTIDASTVALYGDREERYFDFDEVSLSGTTKYWVVIWGSVQGDGSNRIRIRGTSSDGASGEDIAIGSTAALSFNTYADDQLYLKIHTCE